MIVTYYKLHAQRRIYSIKDCEETTLIKRLEHKYGPALLWETVTIPITNNLTKQIFTMRFKDHEVNVF